MQASAAGGVTDELLLQRKAASATTVGFAVGQKLPVLAGLAAEITQIDGVSLSLCAAPCVVR